MTVYRQHLDSRDGKIYNCVLMPDGKWWSAVDLAWDSGYYKHEDAQSAIPNGCHGPTQGEWDLLNSASGGGQYLKSAGGWAGFNGLDTYGFALSPTGYVNGVLQSSDRSYHAVFPYVSGGLRGFMSASPYSYAVGYGYSGSDQPYSYKIRFIVDVFNEPTPSPYDFQPPPGTYTSPQSVSLNKSGFVYTTDGSDPTDDSKPFISPIRISGPTEIKVKRLLSPEIFTFAYIVKGKPMEQYKQQASMQAGAASMEFITRTQTL